MLTTSDVNLIKKVARSERLRSYPKLPRSRKEALIAIRGYPLVTNQSEQFLLFADDTQEIVAFSTKSNLHYLGESRRIYCDGTFQSCPKFFYQLFTVHGLIGNKTVPLVYCLLPDKKMTTYKMEFEGIKKKCEETYLTFEPEEVSIDFELAIHEAVKEVWPSTLIRGCRFHLGQNWWRKIQALGLSRDYREDGEVGQFLKLFFGLPFLKPEDIEAAFVDDIMSIQPSCQRVQDFTEYVLENYVSEDALFPPAIWASFEVAGDRTTNSCEGFHGRLNASLPYPHPNIFILSEVLKDVQSLVYVSRRTENQPKTRFVLEKEAFLREKMAFYAQNRTSRIDFIRCVSLKFQPILN